MLFLLELNLCNLIFAISYNVILDLSTMELLLILFIDENLKDTDPLKWVGLMNNYKNSAKEIIYSELIAIYFCTVISS